METKKDIVMEAWNKIRDEESIFHHLPYCERLKSYNTVEQALLEWAEMKGNEEEPTVCPFDHNIECNSNCDSWDSAYCCTLCKAHHLEHCDDCDPMDV